jgi:hypothetical protein
VLEQAADCRSGSQRSAKINKEEAKSSSRKLCALESKNSQEIGRNSTTPKNKKSDSHERQNKDFPAARKIRWQPKVK